MVVSPGSADGLGMKAIDSHEVRRRVGIIPHLQSNQRSIQHSQSGESSAMATKPSFIQSNVYPQRNTGKPNHSKLYLPIRGSRLSLLFPFRSP